MNFFETKILPFCIFILNAYPSEGNPEGYTQPRISAHGYAVEPPRNHRVPVPRSSHGTVVVCWSNFGAAAELSWRILESEAKASWNCRSAELSRRFCETGSEPPWRNRKSPSKSLGSRCGAITELSCHPCGGVTEPLRSCLTVAVDLSWINNGTVADPIRRQAILTPSATFNAALQWVLLLCSEPRDCSSRSILVPHVPKLETFRNESRSNARGSSNAALFMLFGGVSPRRRGRNPRIKNTQLFYGIQFHLA